MNKPVLVIEKHEPEVAGRAGELVQMAARCIIQSDEDLGKASDLLKFIKTLFKKAEEERKSITDPINASVKILNAKFKTITDPLDKAEKDIKAKILAFELDKRRKAEEAARIEQARLATEQADRILNDIEATIFDDVPEIDLSTPEPASLDPFKAPAPIRGNYGSTTTLVKRWTFEVTDISKVPPEFLEVNLVAVREEIRKGIRTIEGIRIFETESVSSR